MAANVNPRLLYTGLLPGEIAVTPEVDQLQTLLVEELMAVVRAKGLSVAAAPELVVKVEGLLGPGSILLEYAGRA